MTNFPYCICAYIRAAGATTTVAILHETIVILDDTYLSTNGSYENVCQEVIEVKQCVTTCPFYEFRSTVHLNFVSFKLYLLVNTDMPKLLIWG